MPVHLPNELLNSLEGIKGFSKEAFIGVHESGEQVTSIRVNPFKSSMVNPSLAAQDQWSIIHHSPLTIHEKIPWTEYGYYLTSRPSITLLQPHFTILSFKIFALDLITSLLTNKLSFEISESICVDLPPGAAN